MRQCGESVTFLIRLLKYEGLRDRINLSWNLAVIFGDHTILINQLILLSRSVELNRTKRPS